MMSSLKGSDIDLIVSHKINVEKQREHVKKMTERLDLSQNIYNNDLSDNLGADVKAKLTLISDDTEFIVISRKKLNELLGV